MKSILSKDFRYVRSDKTDVGATFRRVIRERREAEAAQAKNQAEAEKIVTPLKQRSKA